ncbi:unconventional myosin-XVIIIb [Aix galericulata]|nr:unconventional myosin-XVIIIb [Aix galericulata]
MCEHPLCAEPPRAESHSAPEQQKQAEGASLEQRAAQLATRLQELSAPGAPDARAVPALRQQLWDLEASAAEQQKELERQTAAVDHLEQLHQRLELEIERMKQIHQKELEDKDDELEDVRQSCQRRVSRCWGTQGAPFSQVSSDC